MKMKHFLSTPLLSFGLALLVAGIANAQIPDQALESIFDRLNGDDYDARYEARIELQDHVTDASSPDAKKSQTKAVEQQLLDRLESEPLLTTKLWILRQLDLIAGEASIEALAALLNGENEHLSTAAASVLEDLPLAAAAKALPEKSPAVQELALLPENNKASKLASIAIEDTNRTVRYEAFSRLLEKSPSKAKKVLMNVLENGPEESQPDFIKASLLSGSYALKNYLVRDLEAAPTEQKIVILAALHKSDGKLESTVLDLFEADNEKLNTEIYAALGKIGSHKSLDKLLIGIDSRSRVISDAASDALAKIEDGKIDEALQQMVKTGSEEEKIIAIQAMSFRAVDGTSDLYTEIASDDSESVKVRKEAISGLEAVGTVESLPILIEIVINPETKKIQRDAQRALKRMTLRLADPDAAWDAFKAGLDSVQFGSEPQVALLRVLDSAPTQDAIAYLIESYAKGDEVVKSTVMRVLPVWRNWDGGHALLEIAASDSGARSDGFSGVGKLILGSNQTYPIAGKFALAGKALEMAESTAERSSVIEGFRYSTWRELVWLDENETDPDLKEAIVSYVGN